MPKKSKSPWPAGHGKAGDQICIERSGRPALLGRILQVGYANEHGTPCVVRVGFKNRKPCHINVFASGVHILPEDVPKKAAQFAKKYGLIVALSCCNNTELRYRFMTKQLCNVIYVTGTVEHAPFRFEDGHFRSGKPNIDDGFSEIRVEGADERLCPAPDDFIEYM